MRRRGGHPAAAAALIGLAILTGFPVAMSGCAATGASRATGPATAPDVTGGLDVEMLRTSDDHAFARYRVDHDGTLRFGGGADALGGSYSWSGPLTGEEIGRLTTLIRQNGWLEADPPSTGHPPGRSYTITVRGPDRRRSFTVLGDEAGVIAVYGLLDTAARRRHQELLDTLPKAGEQP